MTSAPGKVDFVAGQQGAGLGHFAVFFFAAGRSHGHGASIFVVAEGYDHPAAPVADEFAVQGEAAGQAPGVSLQPGAQGSGESMGINGSEQVVERIVTGHFQAPAFFFPNCQPDGATLVLVERGDFAPDVFDVARTHEQAEGDEGEHRGEGMASAVGAAGIGHFAQRVRAGSAVGGLSARNALRLRQSALRGRVRELRGRTSTRGRADGGL